jgi:hypothetical protein
MAFWALKTCQIVRYLGRSLGINSEEKNMEALLQNTPLCHWQKMTHWFLPGQVRINDWILAS